MEENERRFSKMIVTGGAGFIGSNFIHMMVDKYPEINFIVVDKLTYAGNLANLESLMNKRNFEFVQADIGDIEKMNELIDENTCIVNFAAESHVDNSITGPLIFTETNVKGTHKLLEVARQKKAKMFLHVSTDEVYGSLDFSDKSSNENDILNPSSPYSASKAAAEMLCMAYKHTFDMPIIITRSSNNFGPYQYPEKIIPLFVTNLLEGKKVPVYGTGKNVRDWIYVLDNCEAIEFIIKNGKIGEIYNVGGGNEKANIELTKKIIELMNKNEESIEFVKDRLGHDVRYSLDCKKVNDLGWRPKRSFEEALKETIEWYKSNENWWKVLKEKNRR